MRILRTANWHLGKGSENSLIGKNKREYLQKLYRKHAVITNSGNRIHVMESKQLARPNGNAKFP
ncbi:MAG: hypothetical protein Q8S11_14765 [Daejeonella sp.]|nr:hypothetical protein [Daejeonella sp.]